MNRKRLLLVIDRDGTIIDNDDFPGREADWRKNLKTNKGVIEFILYLQSMFEVTSIVVSNQSGVARGYFDIQTVKDVNLYLEKTLKGNGIKIANWQFCPYVDKIYANKYPKIQLIDKWIKEKSKRKPSPEMVLDGLAELNKSIEDFESILVIGNRKDDSDLAKNLGARFIDVTGKTSKELIDILAVV